MQTLQQEIASLPFQTTFKLAPTDVKALQTSECAFCGAPPPAEFGRKNIALRDHKRGFVTGNVWPSCAGCWSVRAGMSPAELLQTALKIDAHMRSPQPKQRSTQSCSKAAHHQRSRELDRCGAPASADPKLLSEKSCHYCGDSRGCGLDRVDSYACPGYAPRNVVPCCKQCNSMKHTLPVDEFLRHVHRVATQPEIMTKAKRRKDVSLKRTSFTIDDLQQHGEQAPAVLLNEVGFSGVVTAAIATRALRAARSRCFGKHDRVIALMGQGVSAIVFACRNKANRWFALKVLRPAAEWELLSREVEMQTLAAEKRVAGQISCSDFDNGFVRMSLLPLTLERVLRDRGLDGNAPLIVNIARRLLRKLRELQMTHGDLHLQNIAFNNTRLRHARLIDFGKSTSMYIPEVDIAMLMLAIRQFARARNEMSFLPQYTEEMSQLLQEFAPAADVDLSDESALRQMQQAYFVHL